MTTLRDASELLWPAVRATLDALDLKPEDEAARKLAQRYAQIIDQMPDHGPRGSQDQAWSARWLFPLMLDALQALGATPAARAALTKKGGPAVDDSDALSQIRPRRRGA